MFDLPSRTARQRRADLRTALAGGRILRFPGAFSPFVARLAQAAGFDGIYVSGAGVANDLALPDIGLTTLTEVASRARAICPAVDLPVLADADTGFGEPLNVARTLREMEDAGLCGIHLEDQENPKRCGHLDGKTLVGVEAMARKVRAAVRARSDPDFLVIARTDARAVEGLQHAIDRAKAYVDAGADVIFPEALADPHEFEAFRRAVPVPLLANMTEFGKSPLLTAAQLEALGYQVVIYPMTAFRLAMGAVEDGFREIAAAGTQAGLVPRMQTRARLYEVLGYAEYDRFDREVAGPVRKEG